MSKNFNLIMFIFLFSFLMTNCQDKKEKSKTLKEFSDSKYFDEKRILEDKYEVKYNGNHLSFSELELYYSYNKKRKEELLPYLLIMVEKHKYHKLSSTAFIRFLEFYSDVDFNYDGTDNSLRLFFQNLKKVNKGQREFLIYFLETGKLNKDKASEKFLEIIYKNHIL